MTLPLLTPEAFLLSTLFGPIIGLLVHLVRKYVTYTVSPYDSDTGLMLEYYAPAANDDAQETVLPLQTNTRQVSESKKPDLYETIEKTSNYYQDNFAENLANEMRAKRRNDEFRDACNISNSRHRYTYAERALISETNRNARLKARKDPIINSIVETKRAETYTITKYAGKLSHPTKNCWAMSLSEPILFSNKGPDIFQLNKNPGYYFKPMNTGMKEGLSIGYDFISIRDYNGVFNVKISSIKPGDEIERVDYNDIKDKI